MSTWSAHTKIPAEPRVVLELLTDPDAIERWSPVPFQIEALSGDRLASGVHARVAGRLGRIGASFDVEVEAAREECFALSASGPLDLAVHYELFPADDGHTEVWVSLHVASGGGLTGRLLAQATEALLRAGALDRALGRIAAQIQTDQEEMHDEQHARVA